MPNIDLKETYTNNLMLASSGAEQADFVTEVSPKIAFDGAGPRFRFNALYAMRNFAYLRTNSKPITVHQISATTNATLINDFLFMDGKASSTPQNISPFGPQAADLANVTNNRSDVKLYSLSPFLKHRFGSSALSELRYTHDSVTANTGGLLGSQADRLQLKLNSGPRFQLLKWSVTYDKQKIDYHNGSTVDMKTWSGDLRYLFSPMFSLNATAGYEKNNYLTLGENPEGGFWSLGATWTPSERTSIEANAGKRFFGKTFFLSANHRMRHTAWSVHYREDVTTARSQFLLPTTIDTSFFLNQIWSASIPDPSTRQQVVDTFIRDNGLPLGLSEPVNSFTNRVFLKKTLQASVAVNGARNTLVLSAFDSLQEPQSTPLDNTPTLTFDEKHRQIGANALWNWRIGSRTNATASAAFSRAKSSVSDRKDDTLTLKFGLTKQFHPKLKGTIELRRVRQQSNKSGGDIRENAISAFVSVGF